MSQFDQFQKEDDYQVADPNRMKYLFNDIGVLYGRGKLKGEPLNQYLDLLNIYNTTGSLNTSQAIRLNMILAEHYNPVFPLSDK